MTRAFAAATAFVHRDEGQDILEYALLASLIAIAGMLAVGSVGETLNDLWWMPIAGTF